VFKKMDKKKMFIRQTTLPEVGLEGQEKLLEAKIAIIGCGGLGSAAAVYLAATGVGQIHLIDYDKIDLSNLHRQVFYTLEEVGRSKAKSLAKHIKSISSFVSVSIHEEPINKNNIAQQLNDYLKDKTTIIIAHRLSTIRKADYIYVLDRGKIEEEGTHDELMGLEGTFYNYLSSQTKLVHSSSLV